MTFEYVHKSDEEIGKGLRMSLASTCHGWERVWWVWWVQGYTYILPQGKGLVRFGNRLSYLRSVWFPVHLTYFSALLLCLHKWGMKAIGKTPINCESNSEFLRYTYIQGD